jgi:hypothetical protein
MLHLHVAPTTFHKQSIMKQAHLSMLHTHVSNQTMHKWYEWCSCLWNATTNVEAKHLGCYKYHRLHQNDFMNLWYIRHKPCTYLVPRLTLSLNRLKRSSTWSMPPRSTIWCAQSYFRAYGTFGINRATILHRDYLQTDQNKFSLDPRHLGVPSGVSKIISKPMVRLAQTVHLSCAKTNTISKRTETSFHLTYITSEYHGWAQSDFHARTRIIANCAPILHRDWNYLKIDQNELSLDPRHLGVQPGASKMIFEPMLRLV